MSSVTKEIYGLHLIDNGGPGSGNFGHSGRPGQRGGSGEGGSKGLIPDTRNDPRHNYTPPKESKYDLHLPELGSVRYPPGAKGKELYERDVARARERRAKDEASSGSMGHREGYEATEKGDKIVKASIEGHEHRDGKLKEEMEERDWSEEDKQAIQSYTDKTKGGAVNRDLRKCPEPPDCLGANQDHFETLQELTKAPLSAPQRVYRGIYGEYAAQIAQAEPGDVLEMHGMVSTSINKAAASDFSGYSGGKAVVMEITAKTGAYVAGESHFPEELELLQAHGTKYLTKGTRQEGDITIMELEEI